MSMAQSSADACEVVRLVLDCPISKRLSEKEFIVLKGLATNGPRAAKTATRRFLPKKSKVGPATH